jgi:hypothetical protein
LVDKPAINEIDNDVTINGSLQLDIPTTNAGEVQWDFAKKSGSLFCNRVDLELTAHVLGSSGIITHTRKSGESTYSVEICGGSYAYRQWQGDGPNNYTISWPGVANGTGFRIYLEPDNPVHYSSVRNTETGAETTEYIGPVLDVREELEFLRAQVRALMEKLKMTPEGGWPVWDGSD